MSRNRPWNAAVDDGESVCKALRRLLQSAGLEVATFAGGGEFLDSLGVRQPDGVVLDLNLPDVSGCQLRPGRIRSIRVRPVPIIS
jgi:FixJ family two-component response regulator